MKSSITPPIERKDKRWGRYYKDEEGNRYPSVTTIIGTIGNAGLLPWGVKEAVSYAKIELHREKLHEVDDEEQIKDVLNTVFSDAAKRPNAIRDAAGDKGTYLHSLFAKRLLGEKLPPSAIADSFAPKVIVSLDKWIYDHDFTPIENGVEAIVYSKTHCYAGTADAIGYSDGDLVLIDFKTGKNTYVEAELQLAAYAQAYQELEDRRIDHTFVLHVLPSGNLKQKHRRSHEQNKEVFRVFRCLQEVYKWLQANKKRR